MHYALLLFLWIGWCTLHSALISLPVTKSLRKHFPYGFRFYRLFYNLFALITLIPLLVYGHLLRTEPIVTWDGLWRIVPVLLAIIGLFFLLAGACRYDLHQFLGLRQIRDEKACSVISDDCALDTGGILSVVRHPWYIAGILIIWARPLDLSAILINLAISAYLVLGAVLEERKLTVQFGRQYAEYRQRVSMLVPLKWARRQFHPKP